MSIRLTVVAASMAASLPTAVYCVVSIHTHESPTATHASPMATHESPTATGVTHGNMAPVGNGVYLCNSDVTSQCYLHLSHEVIREYPQLTAWYSQQQTTCHPLPSPPRCSPSPLMFCRPMRRGQVSPTTRARTTFWSTRWGTSSTCC